MTEKFGNFFDQLQTLKQDEDSRMFEIARDLDIKIMLMKDKASPMIEEKITRLQELAIKNKDQIESLALDFGMKLN